MFISNVVDRGFKPCYRGFKHLLLWIQALLLWIQAPVIVDSSTCWFLTNDYEIGIYYFSNKYAAVRSKNNDWFAWNQDNVSVE
jgi:hypothetical protein